MKRITPLQKAIFDRHLEAARNNFQDIEAETIAGESPDEIRFSMRAILLDGKVIPGLWRHVLSIVNGSLNQRQKFKEELNKLDIK